MTALKKGDFVQAIRSGEETEAFLGRNGLIPEQVRTLILLSGAYQAIGHYRESFGVLSKALELAAKIDDPRLLALVKAKFGNHYLLTNQTEKAGTMLEEALSLARQTGDPAISASALNDAGNLYSLLGMHHKAVKLYSEGLGLAEKIDMALASRTMANLARAYLLTGEAEKTETTLSEAFEKTALNDDSHDKAFGFINIGNIYHRMALKYPADRDRFEGLSLKSFGAALAVSEGTGDRAVSSYALGYIGQVHEDAGQTDSALSFTRRALFQAQAASSPESLYLWQWQSGRLLETRGNIEEAILSYRGAVQTLQSIRQEFLGDCRIYNQLSFQEVVEPVYTGLVSLLLRNTGTITDRTAFDLLMTEAVQTLELLKTAELQDYFQNTCVTASKSQITRNDLVADSTAIVYFVPLTDRLEIIVGLPGGIRKYTLPSGREDLTKEVRQFRRRLEKKTTREYLLSSQKLYDILVRPYQDELVSQKIDKIIFVPDGPLRTIPMAALHDSREFLIQRFAVAVTPGLVFTDLHLFQRKDLEILMTGLSESVQGFPALPFVPEELESINQLFRGDRFLDSAFRVSILREEFEKKPYSIVHIASHGEFSANAMETYILTWDQRLTMDQLEQLMKARRYRNQPVELLSLSACQSAADNDRAALGLAGVSVKAGAKSALASLWYVNDQATSQLISEFYRQLRDASISKAESLRRAQMKLLEDPVFRHPGYWAPFLLIGNWL